jgi:hypothetical protein
MHLQLCQPVELGASRFGKSNAATPPQQRPKRSWRAQPGPEKRRVLPLEAGRTRPKSLIRRIASFQWLRFSALLDSVVKRRSNEKVFRRKRYQSSSCLIAVVVLSSFNLASANAATVVVGGITVTDYGRVSPAIPNSTQPVSVATTGLAQVQIGQPNSAGDPVRPSLRVA